MEEQLRIKQINECNERILEIIHDMELKLSETNPDDTSYDYIREFINNVKSDPSKMDDEFEKLQKAFALAEFSDSQT